jgi:hypothetical protein
MDEAYNIFECLQDGSLIRRGRVLGLLATRLMLDKLATETGNDHFAVDVSTDEVIFRVDASKVSTHAGTIKRVFQIAYTDSLRNMRAELLRHLGYGVISVIGNDAAKVLLKANPHPTVALFIVGHAAPEQTRKEMVDWLKEKYPNVKILALNPPNQQLPRADFNVIQNGPEKWLAFVSTL